MVAGFLIAACSGLVCLASLAFVATPTVSVWVLLLGRALLGCGESLVVTGALSWGVGLVGPQNAGKVMAWVGIAMYGAYAAGAPAGVAVHAQWGFAGIAVATVFIPLLALAMVAGVRPVAPTTLRRTPFYKVLGAVWVPGLELALSSVASAARNDPASAASLGKYHIQHPGCCKPIPAPRNCSETPMNNSGVSSFR